MEATEIALAFPLPTSPEELTLAKVDSIDITTNIYPMSMNFLLLPLQDLQPQQVFAFLPLRSYGFRFIVQGDFDLPSSREDVNSDSAWNQWLREEIPSLFVDTMDRLKVHT